VLYVRTTFRHAQFYLLENGHPV